MKLHAFATICAVALLACSGRAANTLPPLAIIEKATLAYANCVAEAGRKLADHAGGVEMLAKQAVDSCRDLRRGALALKGVPVMFHTVAEFDATHFSLAKRAVESARTKQ